MGFALNVITPPASEPVTLDELKQWCRVSDDSDDDLITDLGIAAREMLEAIYDCAFVTQTLEMTIDRFPAAGNPYLYQQYSWGYWADRIPRMNLAGTWWPERAAIFVPRPPLQSVSSIQYIAQDGTLTTLATDQYIVDTKRQPGRITPGWGLFWPFLRAEMNAVTVQYVAGFGLPTDAPVKIPVRAKQAIKYLTLYWYENRDETGEVPTAALRLMDSVWSGEMY